MPSVLIPDVGVVQFDDSLEGDALTQEVKKAAKVGLTQQKTALEGQRTSTLGQLPGAALGLIPSDEQQQLNETIAANAERQKTLTPEQLGAENLARFKEQGAGSVPLSPDVQAQNAVEQGVTPVSLFGPPDLPKLTPGESQTIARSLLDMNGKPLSESGVQRAGNIIKTGQNLAAGVGESLAESGVGTGAFGPAEVAIARSFIPQMITSGTHAALDAVEAYKSGDTQKGDSKAIEALTTGILLGAPVAAETILRRNLPEAKLSRLIDQAKLDLPPVEEAAQRGGQPITTGEPNASEITSLTGGITSEKIGNAKPYPHQNQLQAGTPSIRGNETEIARGLPASQKRSQLEASNAWLQGVERNNPKEIADAEVELLGTDMGRKKLQELKVQIGLDPARSAVPTQNGHGVDTRKAAAQERARASQELEHFRQQPGESSVSVSGGTQQNTPSTSEEKLSALKKSGATGVDLREQGSGVGEKAPLRQQGEIAGASSPTQTGTDVQAEIASPSVTPPVTPEPPKEVATPSSSLVEAGATAPGFKGMGGAVPAEFQPQGNATGIKNAQVDAERAKRGLEPTMAPMRETNPEVWDRTMARIDQDPGWQDRLVSELNAKPRAITPEETMAIQHRYVDLQNEYDKSTRNLAQAYDDGRMDQVAELQVQTAHWSDRLKEFEDMTRKIGTESGRSLQARKNLLNRDFSPAQMESQLRAAKGGRPLSGDERLELIETHRKLVEAEQRAAASEEQTRQALSEKAATEAINETLKQKPAYDKRILNYAETIVSKLEKAAQSATDRINKRASEMGLLSGPIDPTLLDDFAIVGSAKIARKALEFGKFADEMVSHFGEKLRTYITDHIKEIWDASQRKLDEGLAKAPTEVKRAVKKTDAKEIISDNKEKIKSAIQKGELDGISGFVQKLVRAMVEVDPKIDRNRLVDEVHSILKESLPNITRREAMDAISGYGDFTPLKKDVVSLKVRDLKGQLQQVAKLEDIQSKHPIQKTGLERREPSNEERRLIKQVNEAKRRYGVVVTDPATQLKSALNARKTAIQNEISDLQYEINRRERIVKQKSPSPTDPELEALKKRRDELKAEHEKIFPKEPISDEQKVKLAGESIDRQIKEVQRQIAEGDIFPGGKKTPLSNPELEAKRASLEALKAERQWLRESIQPKDKLPEERYNAQLKARLTKEIADKTGRMARGDFEPKPKRTPPEISPANQKLQAEAENVRQQWQRKLFQEQLKNRTPLQKFLDTTVKWRQAFIISGIKSIFKLASAAVEGMVILPAREVAGGIIGKIPGLRDVAAKASIEGGFNAKAEAKAISETFSNLLSDFGKNLKGDKPDFEKLYGGRETLPPELQNYVGFLHGALKSPLARNVWTRSFEKLMTNAIDHGIDVTDPLVQMEIGRQAWEQSSFWRFQNKNLVSSIFRQAIRRIEDKGYTKTAAAIKLTFPVVTVPTNIVARVFESIAGIPLGGAKLIKAAYDNGGFKEAVANLSPEQANLIMRNLKTGSIGVAFMLIGIFNPNSFGGYYREGEKRKSGDVKFGSVRTPIGDVPSFLVHNPFLEAAQFGATIRQVADAKMRKKDKETNGLWLGAWTAATKTLEEQPFVREAEDVAKASNPRESRKFLGEQARSILVPQAIQNLAEWMDVHDANGEPIKREPRTVGEHIEMGVPKLREKVPVKKK